MSNMSYCRFQNTLPDLRDCSDNIDEILEMENDDPENLSENDKAELRCCKQLIKRCKEIAESYGDAV